jgi:hypothetical protein
VKNILTLILLTWRIWWSNNASRQQMGFNSVFKGLIIRDILLKTDRKMKAGLRCLIIYILLFTTKIYQHCVYYVRQYVCWLHLYPQVCILHWNYGMWINYITLHLKYNCTKYYRYTPLVVDNYVSLHIFYYNKWGIPDYEDGDCSHNVSLVISGFCHEVAENRILLQ